MSAAAALEAGLFAWACVVAGATGVASRRARRFATPAVSRVARTRSRDVLVVRPCAGAEPTLERTLRSTASLLGEPGVRAVFAVAEPSDSALPIVRRVAAELRAASFDVDVLVTHVDAPNRKAAQLDRVVRAERAEDVIVSIDSDVDLEGHTLSEITTAFDDESVDAAWAPPVEAPAEPTFADRASAAVLGASLHAFPMLAGIDEEGLVGKLFAIRRRSLDAVGGFGALVDVLGEDVELARRLGEKRARIVVLPFVVRSLASGRSLGDVVGRFSRWLGVVRAQRPALLASYPALFFATLPFAALTLISLAWGGSPIPLALACGARVWAAVAATRAAGRPLSLWTLGWIPIADAILAAAFMRAISSRRVVWRGRSLVLGEHGRLEQA